MSADTFTTALFLITAVIAAGVLINAVFPVIYTMSGTFSSATHESDQRIRTDIKIINTFSSGTTAQVWLKNVGSARIPKSEIERSDVFCGAVGNFVRLSYSSTNPPVQDGYWSFDFTSPHYDINGNDQWDPGETVKITGETATLPSSGNVVYFQFTVPNGVSRSTEFTAK